MVITLHCGFGTCYVVTILEGVSFLLYHVQVEYDNYLSILVTVIITSWVPAYLFKLNIVFLYMFFTSQVGCLPSTSNQYSKLVISCRQILFFLVT